MLFKKSSDVARLATLQLAVPIEDLPPPDVVTEPAAPSLEAVELARLQAENAELKRHVQAMKADHDVEVEAAYRKALVEAESRHVRNDKQLLETLDRALASASRQFETVLSTACGPAAVKLAAAGFGKLVELRQQDEDWLVRIVVQRLATISTQASVILHVSPDIGQSAQEALAASGRTDVALKLDKAVPAGTARISLKLGEIVIDPSQGVAAIMALFEDREGEDE
ncbi:hypothetical protein [Sphingomonas colocasiae]|uniref:Flagellar assembly protein FliH/Type III secretion system HrpE domain-containing protein n=1 Tax=Sphingomonas colocasiae TaxID=1848973 RepID=A0ABS7PWH0_9SPHN|nr:hypothetical protein [Sphingomonas colocasiae]MBY8825558.1 hypothetical protein [Sphingomonas colocasiae]